MALDTNARKKLAELLYEVLKTNNEGLDAIYEDHIIDLIGIEGFLVMREFRLLTTCGSMHGRNLYVLS